MPQAALRVCSHVGCTNLVRSGRCDLHRSEVIFRRAAERQKLYGTARWQRIRKIQLAREPWCADCLKRGIYVPATDVDHVIPHKGDKKRFFLGPFQSFCKSCHSRKTSSEVRGRGA